MSSSFMLLSIWLKMSNGPARNCMCEPITILLLETSQDAILTLARYLKRIDTYQNNHIHCLLTGGNVKFMLLMNADPTSTPYSNYQTSPPQRPASVRQSTILASNPNSQQTEDAVRQFMLEVRSPAQILEVGRNADSFNRCTKHGSNAL